MNEQLREYCRLQSHGARDFGVEPGRRGGAGPADAKAFVVGGSPLMIPTLSRATRLSDYALRPEDGALVLKRGERTLGGASAVPRPRFYDLATAEGVPYVQIARLHGADCLASTVIQECVRYNDPRKRCRFCAIGASLEQGSTIHTKTPEQLAEVALAARDLDNVRHVTLTSGTTADVDQGVLYLGRCARAVKKASGLPVQVQFEPPADPTLFVRLKEMGVDNVGLHIESFDQAVRERVTPGKAELTVADYFRAFEQAVAVFGRNKVSTYVILGLGEDEALTQALCGEAAQIGVYPFLVPLRPLVDSYFANVTPPDPEYLHRMYVAVGQHLKRWGLSSEQSEAGCVRCRACSLLQFTEKGPAAEAALGGARRTRQVELSVARTPQELEEYYRVRHEVFVEEQGLFQDSDRDARDDTAIPIVARVGGQVAGVVRCYPQRGGVWFGGRLAVRRAFRTNVNVGAMLVCEAVARMTARDDVRRFLATIQRQNVPFFKRLGWVCLGKPFDLNGCRHQIMEKTLERKPS